MALIDTDRLRELLGESIPDGESADSTLFSDGEIEDFLTQGAGNIERAAYEGWRVKAARLSNLVDTTEGNSQRKYSQLYTSAMEMIKMYARSSSGSTEGRARVGKITRPAVPW